MERGTRAGNIQADQMKPKQASRTAEYMALFRALESARPAGKRLVEDRLASAFLHFRLRLVADLARIPPLGRLIRSYIDYRWPGARSSAIARTCFIDGVTEVALATGIEQIVILGAGFDARAYRLAAIARATVFEVDHPSTSAAKRTAVTAALASVPPHVHFVAVDFNAESLHCRMSAAGYHAERRALFIWEGVTNYLTETAVDQTLRWCANAAAGSKVLFTYVDRQIFAAPYRYEGVDKLFATLRAAGEHWTFGLDPSGLSAFLAERGLLLEQDIGAGDYRALYYGNAASKMRGYEFYRIAVARVPAAPLHFGRWTAPAACK
jgi:methyltransferase (TIGR00027 family)